MTDSMRQPRLLFAGFHPLILEDSLARAGEAYKIDTTSGDESLLLQAVDQSRPDVLLLDLLQTSSLRTIQRVTRIRPSCRVVALTGMRWTDVTDAIYSAGASGILYRFDAAAELFVAVQAVLSGQRYLSPTFLRTSTSIDGERLRQSNKLSASDELVLRLVARDYPAHRIARALGLSVGTVRLSIAYLKRQFGRRTNRALKDYAISHDQASDFP